MLAPANSNGREQEDYINKSFHSVWVHDVTTATVCVAQVQMDLQDAAAWGQGMPRLKSAILLLNLWVWSYSFFFTHRGFWSALLRCELGTPLCVVLVWTGQTQLGNTHCSTLGTAARVRNESEPFVVLVSDKGPGPKIRGWSSSACGLQFLTVCKCLQLSIGSYIQRQMDPLLNVAENRKMVPCCFCLVAEQRI